MALLDLQDMQTPEVANSGPGDESSGLSLLLCNPDIGCRAPEQS
ncbi:MAG: SapB/AmfS family lanthipeptide [Pseudonocardiaceae bacterium]